MKSLRAEDLEEDAEDEQTCNDWLFESDSSSSSGESDWINVESDGSDDLEISDSDSEIADSEHSFTRSNHHEQSSTRTSSLATTKVRNIPCILYEAQADTLLDTYASRFCFNKRPKNQSCHCGHREDKWVCHQTEARSPGSEQKVCHYG